MLVGEVPYQNAAQKTAKESILKRERIQMPV